MKRTIESNKCLYERKSGEKKRRFVNEKRNAAVKCVLVASSKDFYCIWNLFWGEESVGTRKKPLRVKIPMFINLTLANPSSYFARARRDQFANVSCLDVKSFEDAIGLNILNQHRFLNALLDSLRHGTKVDVDHKESNSDCFFDMQFKS